MDYDNRIDDGKGNKKRFVIPSIVAGVIIVAVAIGLFALSSANGAVKPDDAKAKQADSKDKNAAKDQKDAKDEKAKDEKAPIPVSVASIATEAVSSYVTSTANLVAENEVKVFAEAEGRVAQLNVDEGTHVSKGMVLATLVPDDAEIAVRKAEVRANNAQVDYERLERLADQNLVSRGDFDKASMDRDVAKQELAEAKWRLSKTVIRAPFSGIVSHREITVGKHVRPGDSLFTVTDFDPLIADIYLPEKEVMSLDRGRGVQITSKADENVKFQGRIRQISPVVDTATGTVKVTVEAVRPPANIRPGAFVQIDIVKETHPGAIVLPREAIIRELQKSHVFVADGSKAVRRDVTLGIEEGTNVEVLGGVKPGEQVIVAGQGGLKDGSKIKVLSSASDEKKAS